MMPRTGSYGETPTVTRSPGTTLIRKRRMRPLSWASTSWPASHCTRYRPPLWTATTVPCMSIRSSLLKLLAILSVHQTNIVPHRTRPRQGDRSEFFREVGGDGGHGRGREFGGKEVGPS